MKHRMHALFAPYMAPAGEDTASGGGGGDKTTPPDRGDKLQDADTKAIADKDAEDKALADKAAADKVADDKVAADKLAADTAAAAKEKDEKSDKKDDKNIPVSRHTEILRKEREAREEAEKKLAAYQGGDKIKVFNKEITDTEAKIDELQAKYDKAIADGALKDAKEHMSEIRKLDKGLTDKKIAVATAASVSEATERMRYSVAVERLEEAYPVLNPDHDDHDSEKAQDVLDLASTYSNRQGLTPTEAIQKAAKKLLGAETAKQEKATDVKPKVDADEAAKVAEEARKKAQVDKNLDANKKQPADTSKVGADSDKAGGSITSKDVLKMSQDDFKKLDEETLARMRGDVIA